MSHVVLLNAAANPEVCKDSKQDPRNNVEDDPNNDGHLGVRVSLV